MRVRLKEKIPGVFWPVHTAIRSGGISEVVAKGGRGSGKSSYLSLELVLQLLRHPDCHAVVLRKVAGTLRNSSDCGPLRCTSKPSPASVSASRSATSASRSDTARLAGTNSGCVRKPAPSCAALSFS